MKEKVRAEVQSHEPKLNSSQEIPSKIDNTALLSVFSKELLAEIDPASKTAISPEMLTKVKGHHYGFVTGILGELIRNDSTNQGYYGKTLETLHDDFGVDSAAVFYPASYNSIEQNAPVVHDWLEAEYIRGGNLPMVILAHSKGAAETLLAVLQNPDLVLSGKIDRLVFVQGAFQGSHIADAAVKAGKDLGTLWPGLGSVTTSYVQDMFRLALADFRSKVSIADQNLISSKISYVRSWQEMGDISHMLAACHFFLSSNFGPNDGTLLTAEEKLEGIGTDWGMLQADHRALVATDDKGEALEGNRIKHAFARTFLHLLFDETSAAKVPASVSFPGDIPKSARDGSI